ncbi:MAG: hypothetical protein ACHREM_26770 [Polyangiales bacterium]
MKHRVTIATHFVIASVAAVMASCPGLPEACPAMIRGDDPLDVEAHARRDHDGVVETSDPTHLGAATEAVR